MPRDHVLRWLPDPGRRGRDPARATRPRVPLALVDFLASRTPEPRQRPRRTWVRAGASALVVIALGVVSVALRPPHAHGDARATPLPAVFATSDAAIPDDTVLLRAARARRSTSAAARTSTACSTRAIPASWSSTRRSPRWTSIDRNLLGIDTLFIVGDELFGYLFRPENGWGSGRRRPQGDRLHAAACVASSTGRPADPTRSAASAATRRAAPTAPARRRRTRSCAATASASAARDQRNPPHVLGLGPIACLAREMSAELQAAGGRRRASARTPEGQRVEQPLTSKGVSFGRIAAEPDGTLDYGDGRGRRSRT